MKLLWIVLINIGALYGPIELTRVILDWEGFSGSSKFMFEIGFMWLFYIGAMIIAATVIARGAVFQN